MSRPRFLLDIDGVCADFLGAAIPILHELTGTLYRPEDFPTWDLFDTIPEKYEAPFYDRCRRAGFCMGLRPYPGTLEGVASIHGLANVRVVTSPIHGDAWYFERAEWCKLHLGVIPKHVIHKSEKETEHGDYLLDDKPAHVEAWAKAHPAGIGLLWSQPYNQRHVFPGWLENVCRVSTWAEVERVVRSRDGDELWQRRERS